MENIIAVFISFIKKSEIEFKLSKKKYLEDEK